MNADPLASGPAQLRHSKWMLASGNFLFHVRNGLFPVLFLLLILIFRPAHFLGKPEWDRAVMFMGAAIAMTGQFVRLFVIGYAYIRRGGRNRQIHADDLVVAGLYAHSRNPMYLGNFLIACGVSLYYGSLAMCALVIPFFGWVYLAITVAEENYLFGKFGARYAEYMRQVNRFIPDLRGLSQSLAGHRFRWREVLSKEYGTLFSTLAGLVLISIWKTAYLEGWEAKRTEIFNRLWLFVPLLIFYGVVRFLKVTRRLREPGVEMSVQGG